MTDQSTSKSCIKTCYSCCLGECQSCTQEATSCLKEFRKSEFQKAMLSFCSILIIWMISLGLAITYHEQISPGIATLLMIWPIMLGWLFSAILLIVTGINSIQGKKHTEGITVILFSAYMLSIWTLLTWSSFEKVPIVVAITLMTCIPTFSFIGLGIYLFYQCCKNKYDKYQQIFV